MRRRDFIIGVGSAAAWPIAAWAQQAKIPVVGFLHAGAPETSAGVAAAFRKGLGEMGFIPDRNVAIEYRWAHNQFERLPDLAAELVRQQVDIIATPAGTAAALAAKGATTTIPIVFGVAVDPVQTGLVASLNHPGGNVTGVSNMTGELGAKRLGLLHEVIPRAKRFGVLVNPTSPLMDPMVSDLRPAVAAIEGELEVLTAITNRDIEGVFANAAQKQIEGLLITNNTLFNDRRVQIAILAATSKLPVIYYDRSFVEAGGLMSYAASPFDRDRVTGIYTARVLKGEMPADLPVMRSTKFEFVINGPTARALGLNVPPTLLAIADEVIE
jgi:putative ABC transport system substrate-binding protein